MDPLKITQPPDKFSSSSLLLLLLFEAPKALEIYLIFRALAHESPLPFHAHDNGWWWMFGIASCGVNQGQSRVHH